MAVAVRKADEIRNQGRKQVSEIYAQFREYPELRIFLDKLNALEESFSQDTTLILDQRFPPIDLFQTAERSPIKTLDLDRVGAAMSQGHSDDPK